MNWSKYTIYQRVRMWIAQLMCPYSEPFHYHHDGCPSCHQHWE